MNFLAHLWIADATGTSMPGAILGDIVRGSDLSAYPDEIATGIRLHRRVDALTDRHRDLQQIREGFAQGQRRYAGIVMDIVCDHLLATQWSRHSAETLPGFCLRSAHAVAAGTAWFEHAGSPAPQAASFAQLLQSYAEPPGVDLALQRIANRLRHGERLMATATQWPDAAAAIRPRLPVILGDLLTELEGFDGAQASKA